MEQRNFSITSKLLLAVTMLLVLVISSAVAATATTPSDDVSFVSVSTPSGTYRGISSRNNFNAFLGIRYAQAPVGSLRWSAPIAMPRSMTIVNATEFGSTCIQPSSERVYTSEDCLFLNVWTPPSCSSSSSKTCSVLIHVHGGGWVTGAGSDAMYWGDFFSNTTDTIVVTFNYRLGALGFLVLPNNSTSSSLFESNQSISEGGLLLQHRRYRSQYDNRRADSTADLVGNFGFLDQRMAIQWVAGNIAAFGGDPNRITLQGQSAGGISVATHLTAPASFGLFQQVAVLSNPTAIALRPIENSTHFATSFARHLGCDISDRACLNSKNSSEILAAQKLVLPDILPPYPLDTSMISPWMIVVDHVNVIDSPSRLVQQHKIAPQVRALVWGTTKNETNGWISDIPFPLTVTMYERILYAFFGSLAEQIYDRYPAKRASDVKSAMSFVLNDYAFTCAVRSTVRSSAAVQPTATYVWMHQPSTYPRNTGTVSHCTCSGCACHGAELTSIFHTATFANGSFTPSENTFSLQTLSLWSGYTQSTFKPSTTFAFPQYNAQQDNALLLDLTQPWTIAQGYRSEYCDFWDSLGVYNY